MPQFAADYHIHTVYAKHAHPAQTVRQILEAASVKSLRRIVLLEHVPEISSDRPGPENWKAGRNDRRSLQKIKEDLAEVAGQFPEVEVLRGVEVDADPWAQDGSLMLEDLSDLDLVVLATHIFPGGHAFWFEPVLLDRAVGEKVALQWWQWVLRAVRHEAVNVLAHPGDILGARELISTFADEAWLERFEQLFRQMVEHQVAFELNELLSCKLRPVYLNSYAYLVRRAKSCGVRFIIGSDAHLPQRIGEYHWVRYLMEEGGLSEEELWDPPKSA